MVSTDKCTIVLCFHGVIICPEYFEDVMVFLIYVFSVVCKVSMF